MAAFLGFLLLVIPVIYIYSFFRPEKFNIRTDKNPSGKYSRMKFTGITALVWWAIVAIGGIFIDTDTESVTAKSSEPTAVEENQPKQVKVDEPTEPVEEAVATPQEPTLGLTVDEYGNKYMTEVKELGLGDFEWGGVDLKEGAVNDTFTMKLSDAISLMGVVDKNGELKSLTYIMGKTNEGDKEALNMLMLAGITAKTLTPELPKEQTAGVVGKLTTEAVEKFSKEGEGNETKVVGDVKYTAMANEFTGLWIIFSPKDS